MATRTMAKVGRKMIQFKLKEYLDEISIYWLAEVTGIRYATLHDMINNKRQNLNMYYVDAVMTALNVSDMNLILEKVDEEV